MGGQCTFRLNNDDVTKLAMALPQLESLLLGYPCSQNTCATTVACLLPISVYCVKLRELEIHFNTTNIVDDLESISKDPWLQDLRSLPRCTLSCHVGHTSQILDEPGLETVVNGTVDIFPSLREFYGFGEAWLQVYDRIMELRKL